MQYNWLRTDFNFDIPLAILQFSVRDTAIREALQHSDPEEVAQALYTAITEANPALVGCIVMSMQLSPGKMQFEAVVAHRSFRPVPWGESPPVIDMSDSTVNLPFIV